VRLGFQVYLSLEVVLKLFKDYFLYFFKKRHINMKFKWALFITLFSLMIFAGGCGVKPGQSNFVGQAVLGFSDAKCVQEEWWYQDGNGKLTGPHNGCIEGVNEPPWCALKTVYKEGKQVYLTGGKQGINWKYCDQSKQLDLKCQTIEQELKDNYVESAVENCAKTFGKEWKPVSGQVISYYRIYKSKDPDIIPECVGSYSRMDTYVSSLDLTSTGTYLGGFDPGCMEQIALSTYTKKEVHLNCCKVIS